MALRVLIKWVYGSCGRKGTNWCRLGNSWEEGEYEENFSITKEVMSEGYEADRSKNRVKNQGLGKRFGAMGAEKPKGARVEVKSGSGTEVWGESSAGGAGGL
jgi:hypothetical protein